MSMEAYEKLIHVINNAAELLSTDPTQRYVSLLNQIGDARFVLIGEASHGTHEFYQTRIEITQQLIEKRNFMAVAIEGDWPDVYRIHRYVQGINGETNAEQALADFKRFPTWMWRNITMLPFLNWLKHFNDGLSSSANKVGFYGLDLYSLNKSMQAVIHYLSKVDAEAADEARLRYACFDHMKLNPQQYGFLTSQGVKKPCVQEAIMQLMALQERTLEEVRRDGMASDDELFYATQNARLVKNAEYYYRTMFEGHIQSWNVRDYHMAETLNLVADHLEKKTGQPARIIVWAHNSHVGDARATEVNERDEINIGQLTREKYGEAAYLIGFSTYQGTVTAASDWDAPHECKKVNPGIEGSYEALFHDVKYDNFLLHLRHDKTLEHYLKLTRLQRAIGVIYRPETERISHYLFTRLPYQFDSIIHLDRTKAVQALD